MGGTGTNQRTILTANDWMRQVEKRLLREERRPQVHSASDLMGPGLGPYTVPTADWNSPETQFNGMFMSQPGAVNSPDGSTGWIGMTQGTADGGGYQLAYDVDPTTCTSTGQAKIRFFCTPPGGLPTFGDWTDLSTGGAAALAAYTWVEGSAAASRAASVDPVEAGTVVGEEIPAVGESGHLYISQIDAQGFNNDYFEVSPGDSLVVQSVDGGVHELQATSRDAYPGQDGNPAYASIDYVVNSTDETPVLNKPVDVTLLAGAAGDVYLQDFNFATPTQVWTMVHNQGTRAVSVYATDNNGDQLIGELLYQDDNTVSLGFYFPQTGVASVYR